jgi:hypothetical protein
MQRLTESLYRDWNAGMNGGSYALLKKSDRGPTEVIPTKGTDPKQVSPELHAALNGA